MKKMFVAFGIAIALICGMSGCADNTPSVEETNAQTYEMVYEKLEGLYGDEADEYEISPRITKNGYVYKYIIRNAEGEAVYTCTVLE